MIELREAVAGGTLRAQLTNERFHQPFLELIASLPEALKRTQRCTWAGLEAMVKTEVLRGKARWRYALRKTGREREFANLTWLHRHRFRVVPPLAAGTLLRHGLPTRQWLVTEYLSGEVELGRFAREENDNERRARRFDALAKDVAHMHALGFVHRDLYPRNLLVSEGETEDRPVFLDAWRGGPGFGLRGPSWDLGCLFLEEQQLWRGDERKSFLDSYFRERHSQGSPVQENAFLRAVNAARETQLERVRVRRERRGRERTES